MMNKGLQALGVVGGLFSAILLTVGMPSFGDWRSFDGCSPRSAAVSSRTLSWSGDDFVEIRVPAEVRFTVAPEWRASAEGPSELIQHLRIRDGALEFDRPTGGMCGENIRVELAGPGVRQWIVAGSGDLNLSQLKQAELDLGVSGSGSVIASGDVERTRVSVRGSGDVNLEGMTQTEIDADIHGSGTVTASGKARQTHIDIYGSGDARFARLELDSAFISVHGSGDVVIAPAESADIRIYGSGNVRLQKRPKNMQSHVHGSGNIFGG